MTVLAYLLLLAVASVYSSVLYMDYQPGVLDKHCRHNSYYYLLLCMGALVHGLGACEPTCTPLATPLDVWELPYPGRSGYWLPGTWLHYAGIASLTCEGSVFKLS